MKSFGITLENNKLHMRCKDGGYELIVDANTLILKQGGKIARTYRLAGAKWRSE